MERQSNEVNIPKSNKTPFYRYTRPLLKISGQGKNQSSTTLIDNMLELSKDLETKPEYILKYFGLSFNTPIFSKPNEYGLKGKFTLDQLEKTLETFIEKFILCSNCGLPELTLGLNKNSTSVTSLCRACGDFVTLPSSKMSSYLCHQLEVKGPELRKDAKKKKHLESQSKQTNDNEDYFLNSMKNNPLTQNMFAASSSNSEKVVEDKI